MGMRQKFDTRWVWVWGWGLIFFTGMGMGQRNPCPPCSVAIPTYR